MEKRYFTKNVRSLWGDDRRKTVYRYIVTPKEWDSVRRLCEKVIQINTDKESSVPKWADSIQTYNKEYIKSHETEPEMPSGSKSFILYEDEAVIFEDFCINLLFNIF